ncbi:MAG: hypothetical protein K2L50_06560 [Bacteroidales bacterium]|nr:hypothetical protein [Bacteroidales bacterium]
MKLQHILPCAVLSVLAGGGLRAQEVLEKKADYNEKVLVTAPYQPSLGALIKPVFTPHTLDTVLGKIPVECQIISRPFATAYPIENIKPAKILGEPIPKLFNSSVRAGVGLMGRMPSPLGELNFSVGRSRKYELAVYYRHQSAYGNIKGYDRFKTNHSLNEADVLGRIFADKFITSLDISYGQKAVNCFGYGNDALSFASVVDDEFDNYKDQSRRWYQNARGILSFEDNATESTDLRFDAKVDYNLNLTNWRSAENSVVVEGGVSKVLLENRRSADVLSLGGRVRFEDNTYRDGLRDGHYDIKIVGDLADDNSIVQEWVPGNELRNAYHVDFRPTLYFKYDFVEMDVAAAFHVFGQGAGDGVQKSTRFQFNPVVDLKLHIINKILTFFIGTDGGVERNTVEGISAINPYLHPLTFGNLKFTRDKFNAYAGLSGNFSRHIDYRVKVSAHFMEDVLSFDYFRYTYMGYQDYYGYNDFRPEYSGRVFNLRLRGDLNFRWGRQILAHVDATYSHYDKRLYYSPEFKANLSFRYNIVDKVTVYTRMTGYTNMWAKDRRGEDVRLKGCFDWSLGAEYRFIKRMTVFVDLNNIIARRYYRWYDYPAYRFNFMAGLSFDF